MLNKLESNILAMKNIVDMARNDGREDFASLIPLAERVIELAAQHGVHPTVATCSACGCELLPDGSCPNDDPSSRNSG